MSLDGHAMEIKLYTIDIFPICLIQLVISHRQISNNSLSSFYIKNSEQFQVFIATSGLFSETKRCNASSTLNWLWFNCIIAALN